MNLYKVIVLFVKTELKKYLWKLDRFCIYTYEIEAK